MSSALPRVAAILLVFGLAACAENGPSRPQGASPATSAPAKVAPPPAPSEGLGPSEGEVPSEGTETGAAPTPSPPAPEDAPQKQAGPSEEDVADCYTYARATIEHDRRIERDRSGSIGFGSIGSDIGSMSQTLSRVGEESTFDRAYSSCIRSKGYGRQ